MKLRGDGRTHSAQSKRLRTVEDARRAGVMAWYGAPGGVASKPASLTANRCRREVFSQVLILLPHEGSVCSISRAEITHRGDTCLPQHRTHRSSGDRSRNHPLPARSRLTCRRHTCNSRHGQPQHRGEREENPFWCPDARYVRL